MAVGCEVVGADKGLAAAVVPDGADLVAARVELDEGVVVVAGDQHVVPESDERAGAAAVLVPVERGVPAVPGFDVAGGVLDVEEPARAPQRALGVVRIGIDGRELPGDGARAGDAHKPGRDTPKPAPRHVFVRSPRHPTAFNTPPRATPFILQKALWLFFLPQVFSLYPVLNIQLTIATHSARKASVAPVLTRTLTSEIP